MTYKVSNGMLTHRTASLPRAWSLERCDITPREVETSSPGVGISTAPGYNVALDSSLGSRWNFTLPRRGPARCGETTSKVKLERDISAFRRDWIAFDIVERISPS